MMTDSTAVLRVVVAITWAISVAGSEVSNTEATAESLYPSSHVPFENSPTATATDAFHSSNTEHEFDILTTSQDTKPVSTLPLSIATPQTNIEITTSTHTSPVRATTEGLQTSTETSTTNPSTSHVDNATHYPSSEAETSIGSFEFVPSSLDITDHQSLEKSIWIPLSSEAEIAPIMIYSLSTLFESTPTILWSHSTALEDRSSVTVDQMTPSQQVGPTKTSTTVSTPTAKSVTDRPASKSISTKSSTSAPKGRLHDSNEQLTPGAKIAVGVIVTLCILGVILAAVVLYRRFNITHRSLKSFLTSGVRYKTYKNATYKDDEGMLIMPDRR